MPDHSPDFVKSIQPCQRLVFSTFTAHRAKVGLEHRPFLVDDGLEVNQIQVCFLRPPTFFFFVSLRALLSNWQRDSFCPPVVSRGFYNAENKIDQVHLNAMAVIFWG